MLQAVAPSFNFPRATIADGTDHIRPATLRGLAPDQTLILVNGKRRHTSALVNVNGFVGRGAQAVDLNAIPASMIDHIEILRDGAAAQYGSDAIAGVINIVLKTDAPGHVQRRGGRERDDVQPRRDAVARVSGADGGALGARRRSVHDVGEQRMVARAERLSADRRRGAEPQRHQPLAARHAAAVLRRRSAQRESARDPFLAGRFVQSRRPARSSTRGQTLGSGVELYAFGGYGRRRGASAGMWRRANDDRTVRSIYPDGFLPFIKSDIATARSPSG